MGTMPLWEELTRAIGPDVNTRTSCRVTAAVAMMAVAKRPSAWCPAANFLIRPSNSNHLENSHAFPWTPCDCRLHPVSVNLLYMIAISVPKMKRDARFRFFLQATAQAIVFMKGASADCTDSLSSSKKGQYLVGKICLQNETVLRFRIAKTKLAR